jgi:hypothetical protein
VTESDVDLRDYTLVLVSHSLLNGRGLVRANGALVDWAHRSGWGVYQLPEPSHLFDPAGAATPEGRLEDRAQLDFVFSQLAVYLDNGYTLVGVALDASEIHGDAGRAWLGELRAAADAASVPLGDAWLIPVDSVDWSTPPEADLGALTGAGAAT